MCSGTSAQCPPPRARPNATRCGEGATCVDGEVTLLEFDGVVIADDPEFLSHISSHAPTAGITFDFLSLQEFVRVACVFSTT